MTLLGSFFIKEDVSDKLFDIKGTLDSFSKCSDVAYCLGFFSKTVFDNLKLIGKIRNAFAHATTIPDFSSLDIPAFASN